MSSARPIIQPSQKINVFKNKNLLREKDSPCTRKELKRETHLKSV
jgi:hypothetical protein